MIPLGCNAWVKDNDTLWFSNVSFNGLFSVNLKTFSIELVHFFENMELSKDSIHIQMYKEGEELIFIPLLDNRIVVYDIKTKKEVQIVIPLKNQFQYFSGIPYKDGNKIWLFSHYGMENVYSYNIKTKELKFESEMTETLLGAIDKECVLRGAIYNEEIVFFVEGMNEILHLDMLDYKVKRFKIDVGRQDVVVATYDGNDYWLFLRESCDIYKWNPKENLYEIFCLTDTSELDEDKIFPYNKILFIENKIIILNYYLSKIKILDKENHCIKNLFECNKDCELSNLISYGAVFSDVFQLGDELCFVPARGRQMILWNIKTDSVRKIEFGIDEKKVPCFRNIIFRDIMKKKLESNFLYEREEIFTLENYIKYGNMKRNYNSLCQNNGLQIYESLINDSTFI